MARLVWAPETEGAVTVVTYAELVTLVQEYTENDEASFVANLPTFTRLAEEAIFRRLEGPVTEESATGALTQDVATFASPSFFLRPLHLIITASGNGFFLSLRDTSWMRASYPTAAFRGRPRYYSVVDEATLMVAPTPDAAYAYDLRYVRAPESIVTAGASWLGEFAQNALLYGVLCEAARYMKSDADTLAGYTAQFDGAVNDAKLLVEGRTLRDAYKPFG